MHWRAAVKIAYDGRNFMGSQRQPGLNTVESEVIAALLKIEAISSVDEARFGFASRTDRGVSAIGNVAAFNTSFPKEKLLQALNANSENIYYHALAEVPDDFYPRYARGRWYRYVISDKNRNEALLKECAKLFEGTHDFKRFCKADGKDTLKTLDKVEISHEENTYVIDIQSREFLRNMIRRIVAALDSVAKGYSELNDVQQSLEGEDLTFGLAAPEPLILMDVWYDFAFQKDLPDTLAKKLDLQDEDFASRACFAKALSNRECIIK